MDPEPLSVTVLGCEGSYPGPGGACSGYLLRGGGVNIWLDAGSGTLANLQREVEIEDLDAVVLTHEHVDHWTDIEHLAVAARYVVGRQGIPVYAPGGILDLLRVGPASGSLDWHTVADGQSETVGRISLSFSRTDHPVETLAVRADLAGRSVVYSSDTGPGWTLSELGPGADVALCEATFLSEAEGSLAHLSARQAGGQAAASGARTLVITHLWPRVDKRRAQMEASAAYGAPVAVAAPGERYFCDVEI